MYPSNVVCCGSSLEEYNELKPVSPTQDSDVVL